MKLKTIIVAFLFVSGCSDESLKKKDDEYVITPFETSQFSHYRHRPDGYGGLICNDGMISASCSYCSQGCCSHHGGCK